VLLAGGASLPPKIRAVMGSAFDGRDIVNTSIPGNEVFALGAARQAYVVHPLLAFAPTGWVGVDARTCACTLAGIRTCTILLSDYCPLCIVLVSNLVVCLFVRVVFVCIFVRTLFFFLRFRPIFFLILKVIFISRCSHAFLSTSHTFQIPSARRAVA
jgi:hypothetical protein